MRKIFLIGLLFSALFTSAQSNWTNTTPIGGNPATLSTVRGGFRPDGGLLNKSFVDTAAANAAIGMSLNAGSQFYNTTTGTIWYRNNMNMWVEGAATTIYQGTRLVSGSASYSNVGLDYNVTNCIYFILGVGYTSVAATVTLVVADPSLPRKDVIYVDINGLVGVLTGTASTNPEKPQVNPLTQLEITFVDINAGATTPTGVTVTTIYDENIEWGGSSDVAGIDFAYATNPYGGTTVSTYVPAASDGTYIKWTNSSTLDITDNQYLKFYIRLNGSLTGSPTAFLTISFFDVATQTTQDFIVANGSYGFNSSTLNAYQLVVIPIYPPFNTNNFDNVKFVLNGAPSTSFQLDKIYLVSGSSLPPPSTPIAWNVTGLNDISSNPLAGIGTSSYDDFRVYTNNTLTALFSKDGITQSTDTVHKLLILDTATGRFYWDYRPSIFTDSPLYKYVVNEKNHIAADTTDATPTALATQYDILQKWGINGNEGTIAGINFIGTLDDVDLVFKRNNLKAGRVNTSYTAFGYRSLDSIVSGINTAYGAHSLRSNSTGSFNTGIGTGAIISNNTGNYNTGLGYAVMNGNIGSYNTGVGARALFSSTGNNNTGVGNASGLYISTGSKNTSIGDSSLVALGTGSRNTTIGANADVATSSTDSSVAIGADAVSGTRQLAFSPHVTEIKATGITGASNSGYVLTTNGSGIATFQAAGGSVLTGNVAYVDAVNGDDGTGTLGDFTKPYLTLEAAKAAATSGYTIVVRPGTYTVSTSIAKDSVDWYFYPNTFITMAQDIDSTGIWDDGGTEMRFTVTGSGKFTRSTTDEFLAVNLINVTNVSSVINIEAEELITSCGAEGQSTVVNQHDGNLTINARIISALNGGNIYAIWWWNGTMNINATKIYSEYACIASSVSGTPTGDAHVTANEMHAAILGNGVGVVAALGTNSDAAIWVHANTIRGSINSTSSNKVYVEAQKIFHRIITSAGAGLVYVTTDKITDIGSGVLLIEGGTVRLNVDHIDPSTFDGSMSITGGELQLNNANYIATSSAVGMTVSGGTARLTDCNFTTSANSGTSPLIKSGGILTIRDCILVAESTSTSISAPTSQTVISYNSFGNKAIDADVTINGILTIGSYVE